MVKFIAFSPLIDHIIRDVVDNKKYDSYMKIKYLNFNLDEI